MVRFEKVSVKKINITRVMLKCQPGKFSIYAEWLTENFVKIEACISYLRCRLCNIPQHKTIGSQHIAMSQSRPAIDSHTRVFGLLFNFQGMLWCIHSSDFVACLLTIYFRICRISTLQRKNVHGL